eukprot:CAMPEP_0196664414 /NCGR_PEP_ID=MMETSP1086-20130531/57077_1 /TAXON_ID=77921 /ORGANISM="Cyanoptyche  gloeocystis , Strain SAG4.97" /LENGTH=446 /DNA_ID=CAMNT_0042000707 /DNA_START=228 /DNA_END=1566 /DNA_ORIENTATION=+
MSCSANSPRSPRFRRITVATDSPSESARETAHSSLDGHARKSPLPVYIVSSLILAAVLAIGYVTLLPTTAKVTGAQTNFLAVAERTSVFVQDEDHMLHVLHAAPESGGHAAYRSWQKAPIVSKLSSEARTPHRSVAFTWKRAHFPEEVLLSSSHICGRHFVQVHTKAFLLLDTKVLEVKEEMRKPILSCLDPSTPDSCPEDAERSLCEEIDSLASAEDHDTSSAKLTFTTSFQKLLADRRSLDFFLLGIDVHNRPERFTNQDAPLAAMLFAKHYWQALSVQPLPDIFNATEEKESLHIDAQSDLYCSAFATAVCVLKCGANPYCRATCQAVGYPLAFNGCTNVLKAMSSWRIMCWQSVENMPIWKNLSPVVKNIIVDQGMVAGARVGLKTDHLAEARRITTSVMGCAAPTVCAGQICAGTAASTTDVLNMMPIAKPATFPVAISRW